MFDLTTEQARSNLTIKAALARHQAAVDFHLTEVRRLLPPSASPATDPDPLIYVMAYSHMDLAEMHDAACRRIIQECYDVPLDDDPPY